MSMAFLWHRLAAGGACALMGMAAVGAASGTADDASDRAKRIDRWLHEKPTPAIEVLLLEGAGDPRVDEHWRASLSHPEAAVRGAAARAVRAAGRASLLADIDGALAREADALAASELAEASIELSGRLDTPVLEVVRKWPDPLAPLIGRTIARRVPAALPDFLLALSALEVPAADPAYAEALAYVWRLDAPSALATCERLARQGSVTSWRILAGAHARMHHPLSRSLVAAFAAAAGARGVDEAVSDYLASALGPRGHQASVVAARAELEGWLPAGRTPELRLLRELLARTGGVAPSDDIGALAAQLGRRSPLVRLRLALDPVLQPAEREAVSAIWGTADPLRAEAEDEPRRLGFADDVPYGVWKSLEGAAACRGARGLVSVHVTYDATGRPSRISPPQGISDGCRRALVVLARISTHMGQGDAFIGLPLGVSVPEGFASRSARTPRAASGEGDSDLQPPSAKRSVQPTYPFAASQEGVSGRVWLDILIDETGRVRSARVTKGVDVRLDAEALLTMLDWRFTAARLNGWNVPSRATVEMSFLLREEAGRK